MKQTRELDNACGLLAALHIFGNYKETIKLPKDSVLNKFFDSTTDFDQFQRAKFLENFTDLKEKHQVFANYGQSFPVEYNTNTNNYNIKEKQPIHHFISFVNLDNNLIEMDGTLDGPLLLKTNIPTGNFLIEVLKEISKRINKGIIREDLSIMILTYC